MAAMTQDKLQLLIEKQRNTGGAIYIKRSDENGNPLNFRLTKKGAVSGVWGNRLKNRKIDWLLIYHKLDNNTGKVWTGDYTDCHEIGNGKYELVISNPVGPILVNKSFKALTDRPEPRQPIYLAPARRKVNPASPSQEQDKEVNADICIDLESILNEQQPASNKTTLEQVVLARLGQGEFREAVLQLWSDQCAVTGVTLKEVIRASHIKPWRSCTNKERLNPKNGLPLVASLDALFDRGLISFTDEGDMLISHSITSKQKSLLGVPSRLRQRLDSMQKTFMHYHRAHIFIP